MIISTLMQTDCELLIPNLSKQVRWNICYGTFVMCTALYYCDIDDLLIQIYESCFSSIRIPVHDFTWQHKKSETIIKIA